MHIYYFPVCPINEAIEPPISFSHMGSSGAVPYKCSKCNHLFEGECLRGGEFIGRYLHLDYGFCGIRGKTDPVYYENKFIKAKVTIPRKCSECFHLSIGRWGFGCKKDNDKWGDFSRGLDWGTWQPDTIYFDLPLPKVTTKALCYYATSGNLIEFIKEYRRVNPDMSLLETRQDYNIIREKLNINKGVT